MLNIQSKPITVQRLVIELDEEQARAILVDASDFQKQLRSHLAGHTPQLRVGLPTLHGKKKGRRAIPKVQCPGCDRTIAISTIDKHIRTTHGDRAGELLARVARS